MKVTFGSLGFSDCGFVFLIRKVAFHTEPCLEVITESARHDGFGTIGIYIFFVAVIDGKGL